MSEEKANLQGKSQTEAQIVASASTTGGGPPADATPLARRRPGPADKARAIMAAYKHLPPPHTCQQALKITIFFDGTGNNRDADLPTLEHSNVARMYRAHRPDDEAAGVFRRYVPGIGTLFPDIGDPGKGKIIDTHNAMGAMGQARLDWGFTQLQQIISKAELRAQNPTNKIVQITLAVFGFSRGATLARAFVRDLVKPDKGWCTGSGAGLRWKKGGYPLEISFLGLWDTVAAVGVPIGVNNVGAIRRERISAANVVRHNNLVRKVAPGEKYLRAVDLAFGAPGADPAPGPANGHDAWADNLSIPDVVCTCVHMVAAHEIRNSFPLDSVSHGNSKPANCKEIVFPGVHSNVGGGYRPGEGGRGRAAPMQTDSPDADTMLSLIPLRAMYDEALIAGVPLMQPNEWRDENIDDFATDASLLDAFDHYMSIAGRAHSSIGNAFITHQRLYFAWRFQHIRKKQAVRPKLEERDPKRMTDEERAIERSEVIWGQDLVTMEAEQTKLRNEIDTLRAQGLEESRVLSNKPGMLDRNTLLPTARLRQEQAALSARYNKEIGDRQQRFDELQARIDTLPSRGSLIQGLSEYDQALLDDAGAILAAMSKDKTLRARLRPHYRALMEAYENEFIHRRGLDESKPDDRKLIDFFDRYVHDSLSNFQMDSTLPSDPRVIYAGGNLKTLFSAADRDAFADTAAG